MRYSLRTLLIVMLLGGPALAGWWWVFSPHAEVLVIPLAVAMMVAYFFAVGIDPMRPR